MGGGRVISTAAKVAGIGVAKGGFRGIGFPAADHFKVNNATASASASASKPGFASISSVHPPAEDDVVITQKAGWDDWEFAGLDEDPIPRVVFSKPPTLEEAKEATEDLKEAIDMVYMSTPKASAIEGSRMLSNLQSSAIESPALQAFAFLSESTAAQTVVASIASDPKVWDAVMENKDLMKFLHTNTTLEVDNDDKSQHSSTSEREVTDEKPIDFFEILQDVKLRVVRLMESVSSYFGGLFTARPDTEEKKHSLFNDPRSLFGLAVVIIFMVVLKRA